MTCPNCGSPLFNDALISTDVEVRLTCTCGYSEPTVPDAEATRTFAIISEYPRSPDLINA